MVRPLLPRRKRRAVKREETAAEPAGEQMVV
jgi:hypothetical protein